VLLNRKNERHGASQGLFDGSGRDLLEATEWRRLNEKSTIAGLTGKVFPC